MKELKQKIKARLTADGRSICSWAKMRGHKMSTVHSILDGKNPTSTYTAKAILGDLHKDGYLTDEEQAA